MPLNRGMCKVTSVPLLRTLGNFLVTGLDPRPVLIFDLACWYDDTNPQTCGCAIGQAIVHGLAPEGLRLVPVNLDWPEVPFTTHWPAYGELRGIEAVAAAYGLDRDSALELFDFWAYEDDGSARTVGVRLLDAADLIEAHHQKVNFRRAHRSQMLVSR